MFCKYCGSEIEDNVRFCPKCGKPVEQPAVQRMDNNIYGANETNVGNKTSYANASFWLAVAGIPLSLFCGIGLFLGFPAAILGFMAVKNKESNSTMAWLGLFIGAAEALFVIAAFMSN